MNKMIAAEESGGNCAPAAEDIAETLVNRASHALS